MMIIQNMRKRKRRSHLTILVIVTGVFCYCFYLSLSLTTVTTKVGVSAFLLPFSSPLSSSLSSSPSPKLSFVWSRSTKKSHPRSEFDRIQGCPWSTTTTLSLSLPFLSSHSTTRVMRSVFERDYGICSRSWSGDFVNKRGLRNSHAMFVSSFSPTSLRSAMKGFSSSNNSITVESESIALQQHLLQQQQSTLTSSTATLNGSQQPTTDQQHTSTSEDVFETTRKEENTNLMTNKIRSSLSSSTTAPEIITSKTTVTSPTITRKRRVPLVEHSPKIVPRQTGFNVVLTHCTADFDSLASAVGLAKLWSHEHSTEDPQQKQQAQQLAGGELEAGSLGMSTTTINSNKTFDSASHVPTFVVLPRGAHPGVQRFLALHKHLFPIRSLKSLPENIATRLNRLALVDAQRKDRIGSAASLLLPHAKRITVVDHHVDQQSDIENVTDYVVDNVGSVSTLIVERLMEAGISLTEPEATLLALGIHADTGSLCYDSTTVRDCRALTWCLEEGASQTAIAEHAHSSLSVEQQRVLTQALIHIKTTVAHGVSIGSVVLSADGFIQGLAAVTQDALELSSSDIFLLGLVYETKSGSSRRRKKRLSKLERDVSNAAMLTNRVLAKVDLDAKNGMLIDPSDIYNGNTTTNHPDSCDTMNPATSMSRLRMAFDRIDVSKTGYIDQQDVAIAMSSSGIVLSESSSVSDLINAVDIDGDGKVDFNEFVAFATSVTSTSNNAAKEYDHHNMTQIPRQLNKKQQRSKSSDKNVNENDDDNDDIDDEEKSPSPTSVTMIVVGRAKAGVNVKAVKLNHLLEKFGGGGHPKAASATLRLSSEDEAHEVLKNLVNELIETSLQPQPIASDFMTSPVLSVKQNMDEKQVEAIFSRYNVRALPVVDDDDNVIGLVSYQVVEAAKQRRWNKEQRRLRQQQQAKNTSLQIGTSNDESVSQQLASSFTKVSDGNPKVPDESGKFKNKQSRNSNVNTSSSTATGSGSSTTGAAVKGWMLQHVQTVETSMTMAEVEAVLVENDVGSLPVVLTGTKKLVGMVTRTDILRQHRYYDTLPYHNKGYADSIAARKPIIELRKRLKQFDLD